MVDRILDACTRNLAADGYDSVSTYRIAEVAGVSSGSLYQYFPNKDSIVVAAVERMIARAGAQLAERLGASAVVPAEMQIPYMVTAVLAATEENRDIARVLVEHMPRLGGSAEILAMERRATDVLTGYLAGLSNEGAFGRRPAAVWTAVQAVQLVPIRYVLDEPPITRDEFIDQMSRLIAALLPRHADRLMPWEERRGRRGGRPAFDPLRHTCRPASAQ